MVTDAIFEDTKNPKGQHLEQPAIADPVLCRGLGLDGFQRSLLNLFIL